MSNTHEHLPDLEIGDFFKADKMEPILFIEDLFSLSVTLDLQESFASSFINSILYINAIIQY